MEKREWSYSVNVFENCTKGNFHKAMLISIRHNDTLYSQSTSIPYMLTLYNFYNPFHVAYSDGFNLLELKVDTQLSKTVALYGSFKSLRRTKIRSWDIAIQAVYPNNTSEYKYLLPDKRKPFQTGKQIDIKTAVKNLSTKLINEISLANVKAEVDLFYSQLEIAFDEQKASIGDVDVQSKNLELLRISMCEAMFANLGSLMKYFYKTPANICSYFDLESIRRTHQTHYIGHLEELSKKAICKHTFEETDKIRIQNTGTTELKFYLANTKTGVPTGEAYTILPNTDQTISASLLGSLSNKYFMVYNPDDDNIATYIIDLL